MPKTVVIEKVVYTLAELKSNFPKGYQKALELIEDKNTDGEWWRNTTDDFTEILEIIGFSNPEIAFSGFGQQGDGASFTSKGCNATKLVEFASGIYCNLDIEHIAKEIKHSPEPKFIRLWGLDDYWESSVTRFNNNYCHEYSTDFIADFNYRSKKLNDLTKSLVEHLEDVRLELSKHIYSLLKEEYFNLTSEEACLSEAEEMEMLFYDNGKIHI